MLFLTGEKNNYNTLFLSADFVLAFSFAFRLHQFYIDPAYSFRTAEASMALLHVMSLKWILFSRYVGYF